MGMAPLPPADGAGEAINISSSSIRWWASAELLLQGRRRMAASSSSHQIAHQIGHAVLDGVQADLRPGLTKVVDELQHASGAARWSRQPRREPSWPRAIRLAFCMACSVCASIPGILIEAQPRLGQLHAAGQPMKQRRAHLLFEFADLLAERRLGHAQRLGGAGKALFVCHGHQVAQVTEFHIWYVSKLMGLDIGIKL